MLPIGFKVSYEWNMRGSCYFVSSVNSPPKIIPRAPPIGAPAEKVAKAMDLIREGGNAWAKIPICVKFGSASDSYCHNGDNLRPKG